MKKNSSTFRRWLPALLLALLSGLLLYLNPGARSPFTGTVTAYAREMLTIFPAVLVLMGMLSAFISNQFIARHLGDESGLRGMAVAFLLGTLPTGPLYMAFPLASALRKKGARTANMVIFLSAWACIKLPQELVELRFLGARFMAARLLLTILFTAVMGLVIEKLDTRFGNNAQGAPAP